ncbi:MAG: hypothetical protein WCY58_06430 [Mariniphaga sp.]
MKSATKIFLVILIALPVFPATAQRIKATASLDSAHILLGDQVKLFLEIDHPKNVHVEFPEVPDTLLERVEVLERSGIDTFRMDDEDFQKQIRSFLITSFDSGSYRIPPLWFNIEFNGRFDSIPTNGVTLNVYSMPIDTTRGPTDIKMPYGAPVTLKEVTPYIMGTILLAAILFFIFYALSRRKNNKPIFSIPQRPKEPAHVIALRELDRIKQEKLWQKGKTKQYYSEMTEVLRKYIERRFEIPALEQTSDETLASFRYRRDLLQEKTYENLSHLLTLADLVKFARYKPMPDDDNLTLVNAYFFVNDTKSDEASTTNQAPNEQN